MPFDSPGRFYCRSIECKSIIGRKRYFSLHFPAGWNLVREEDANLDFMHKQGILCYLLSWLAKAHGERDVLRTLAGSCSTIPSDKGITIYDTRAYLTLARSKNSYVPRSLSAK